MFTKFVQNNMKPLVTNQRILRWFCVFPTNETIKLREKISYVLFTSIALAVTVGAIVSSGAFFVKHLRTDFKESLYALFQVVSLFGSVNAILAILLSRRKLDTIFTQLSTIYKERKLADVRYNF